MVVGPQLNLLLVYRVLRRLTKPGVEPYDFRGHHMVPPWSCQRRDNASNEKMMKTSVVSCLLQVLSDNAFLRVERRGLDHPVDLPVFLVVREVCLVVGAACRLCIQL